MREELGVEDMCMLGDRLHGLGLGIVYALQVVWSFLEEGGDGKMTMAVAPS